MINFANVQKPFCTNSSKFDSTYFEHYVMINFVFLYAPIVFGTRQWQLKLP
jgi:hypothetical protein